MTVIIQKDLSYFVNGRIFDVHNEVGPGVREECYQKAMELALAMRDLRFEAKPRTRRELIYLGEIADVFEPDLVIEGQLIAELKVQKAGLTSANFRQTVNYLKYWGQPLGLLVNFASAQATIQRVVYHETRVGPEEDYSHIETLVTPELKPVLRSIREALLDVHSQFGIGYSDTTCRRLVEIALRHRGLRCLGEQVVIPAFRGRSLPSSPITPLNVEDNVLIEVEAIQDDVTARSIRTMQTHLKITAANVGLVVNFGKNAFQIRGVRPLSRK